MRRGFWGRQRLGAARPWLSTPPAAAGRHAGGRRFLVLCGAALSHVDSRPIAESVAFRSGIRIPLLYTLIQRIKSYRFAGTPITAKPDCVIAQSSASTNRQNEGSGVADTESISSVVGYALHTSETPHDVIILQAHSDKQRWRRRAAGGGRGNRCCMPAPLRRRRASGGRANVRPGRCACVGVGGGGGGRRSERCGVRCARLEATPSIAAFAVTGV
ncbi:MAG: hypothetical protein J3K34DRAFT_422055, partial [Monoraphidium minutum]